MKFLWFRSFQQADPLLLEHHGKSVAEKALHSAQEALNNALDRQFILTSEKLMIEQELAELDRVIEALAPACQQIINNNEETYDTIAPTEKRPCHAGGVNV